MPVSYHTSIMKGWKLILLLLVLAAGTPTATELQSSIDLFFPLLASPGAQARCAKVRDMGYGARSDFELNFDRYLPSPGQADGDDTGKTR